MKSRNEAGLVHRAAWLLVLAILAVGPWCLRRLTWKMGLIRAKVAKNALAPAAPVLPAEIVDSMQEGRYDEAGRLLAALAEKSNSTDEKAYFSYRGRDRPAPGRPARRGRELLRKAALT